MQILNFLRIALNKKSRMVLGSLLFFAFVTSCGRDLSQYGSVTLRGPESKNFTFSVSEEYMRSNQDSKRSKKDSKLTEAEFNLLMSLLERKKYCLNDKGKIFFRITSKQEKVYDMTFAHLIEQSYNARPVMPAMYYGECLAKPLNKKDVINQLIAETKAAIK